jgi:hypothetical protein
MLPIGVIKKFSATKTSSSIVVNDEERYIASKRVMGNGSFLYLNYGLSVFSFIHFPGCAGK